MEFEEFLDKVVNVTKVPDSLEFKPAVLWLNVERLPVGVVSLGGEVGSVIKLPSKCIAIRGNTVPVLAVSNTVFAGRTDITDIILPNQLERIPSNTFAGCVSLKRITLPRSLRRGIGQGAFIGCDSLKDIYFEGSEEEWKQLCIAHDENRITNPKKTGFYIESRTIAGNETLFNAKVHCNCIFPEEEPWQLIETNKSLTYVYKRDI